MPTGSAATRGLCPDASSNGRVRTAATNGRPQEAFPDRVAQRLSRRSVSQLGGVEHRITFTAREELPAALAAKRRTGEPGVVGPARLDAFGDNPQRSGGASAQRPKEGGSAVAVHRDRPDRTGWRQPFGGGLAHLPLCLVFLEEWRQPISLSASTIRDGSGVHR